MSIFLSSPWLCTFNGTFKEQWLVIVVWVTLIFMGLINSNLLAITWRWA